MISFLYRQSSRIFTFLRLILTPLIPHFYLFYFPLLIPHVPIKCRKCRLLIWAQKQIANIERSHQPYQKQHVTPLSLPCVYKRTAGIIY